MPILQQLSTCWLSEAGYEDGQNMAAGPTMHHSFQAQAWCWQSLDGYAHIEEQYNITQQYDYRLHAWT